MAKKLDEAQQVEATRLRDWLVILIDFLPFPSEVKGIGSQRANELYDEGNLKLLRYDVRGLRRSADELSPEQQQEVDKLLRARTGMGLREEEEGFLRELSAIVKRGLIRNDSDYQIVRRRQDEIEGDPEKSEEFQAMERLIAEDVARLSKR